MKLRNYFYYRHRQCYYFVYFICISILYLEIVFCDHVNFHNSISNRQRTSTSLKKIYFQTNVERQRRGVLDFVLGRFKTCGGCQCGRSNREEARLLGGEYTEPHEFPWLASIHLQTDRIVSGILINDRYVLTAASALIGVTPPQTKVILGAYDRCNFDVSSVQFSAELIIMHPEFNENARTHDLALIRLSRPTKFEKRLTTVCLPNPGATYLGQVGTLTGWSELTSINTTVDLSSCRSKKVGLPILGRKECLKSGIDPTNFSEDSGCVGVIGTNSIVCRNDIGTSLMYRSFDGIYDLVGIFSDLNQCDGTKAAVFTRVGPHLDWVLQITRDACYCTK